VTGVRAESLSAAGASAPLLQALDGLPAPRRHFALAGILLSIGMAALDGTIVTIALPTIAQELGVTGAAAVWIVTAYQIAIVGSLFGFAALGEILGFRRVYLFGMVLFVAAAAICALSDELPPLLLARAAQGIGGAAIFSNTPALIRFSQPQNQLGRTYGILATTVALCSAAAPSLGAAILALGHWQWLFAIDIPIGLLALAFLRSLPEARGAARRFDWLSAALSALFFVLLILGVDRLAEAPAIAGACLAAAAIAGTLLIRRERRRVAPIVPVDLVRIPAFAFAVSGSTCLFAAQMCAFVALPFLLRRELGLGEIETGVLMTAWPATLAVFAPVAGWLADRFPASVLCAAGGMLMALCLAALGLWPSGGIVRMGAVIALSGVGFGLFQTPNNRAMLLAAPRERSGAAGGALATARQFGQAIGAVFVALCLALFLQQGPRAALLLGAVLALVAATISLRRPHA
jgi:DHA2 family multidrug resistance protein-like MFS transporter